MVSYIFNFTKRMAIKLGRVMTSSEGYKIIFEFNLTEEFTVLKT